MDVIQLTESLIAFDTVSPPGNEEACARFIADYLKDLRIEGSSVELHRFAPGRANLVATFSGGPPGLLLAGHIDVVPPGESSGWSSPPVRRERKGRTDIRQGGGRHEGRDCGHAGRHKVGQAEEAQEVAQLRRHGG